MGDYEQHECLVDAVARHADWRIQILADERKRYAEKQTYAMHLAAADGDIEKIKDILRSGRFNLKHSDRCLGTALHAAVHFRQADSIRMLLWAGADPEALSSPYSTDEEPFTALGLACNLGYLAIVTLLWEKGVFRRGFSDGRNWSALEVAAPMGHSNVLAFLLTTENDWTREEKSSALNLAAFQWKADAVRTLLFNVPYETGALGDALHRASQETRRLCGIDHPPLLDKPEYPPQAAVIKNKFRAGISVDFQEYGETALLEASKSRHTIAALKTLLEYHADPNFRSRINGQTALHIASSRLLLGARILQAMG